MIKITKTKAEIILELSGEYDLKTLKKQYHILGKKHHPDNGGNVTDMQAINAEYDKLFKVLKDKHESKQTSTDGAKADFNKSYWDVAEDKAIREMILDMNEKSYMYRLIQGDVGTGKTIVSAIGLYGNYLRGNIGVFMVPTDSLARQQYDELKKLFEPYNVSVGLLIGAQTPKQKSVIKKKLIDRQIDILVGTHALFSDDVFYPDLGLVVIDEQHRFGVEQRNKLLNKGNGSDLLLMSATPIPRTLALSVYGDLDITTLNEFPNKVRDVKTSIVTPNSTEIINLIRECIDENRQVFVVAPRIENGLENSASAEELFDK